MSTRLGRIVRAADFEHLLKTPSRARSPLFALHHLDREPGLCTASRKLSTGDEQDTHRLVDEHPATTPATPRGHWLGFVVPKRLARRAVTRNLIRRLARASLSAQLAGAQPLPLGMWVLRLRAPIDRTQFKSAASTALRLQLHEDLATLWRRALNPRSRPS